MRTAPTLAALDDVPDDGLDGQIAVAGVHLQIHRRDEVAGLRQLRLAGAQVHSEDVFRRLQRPNADGKPQVRRRGMTHFTAQRHLHPFAGSHRPLRLDLE